MSEMPFYRKFKYDDYVLARLNFPAIVRIAGIVHIEETRNDTEQHYADVRPLHPIQRIPESPTLWYAGVVDSVDLALLTPIPDEHRATLDTLVSRQQALWAEFEALAAKIAGDKSEGES